MLYHGKRVHGIAVARQQRRGQFVMGKMGMVLCFVLGVLVMIMVGLCSINFLLHRPTYEEKTQMREEEFQRVIKTCNEQVAAKPEEAESYFQRGVLYANEGQRFDHEDLPKAVADFTQAIALNPEKAEYFRSRGTVYERLSKDADMKMADYESERMYQQLAENDYRSAVRLAPKTADAYLQLGMILFMQEKPPQEALVYIDKAIAILDELKLTADDKRYHEKHMFCDAHTYRAIIFFVLGYDSEATVEVLVADTHSREATLLKEALVCAQGKGKADELKSLYLFNVNGARLAAANNNGKALECYSAAIEQIPIDWRNGVEGVLEGIYNRAYFGRIYLNRARIYETMGKQSAAAADYRIAAGKSPVLRHEVPESYRQYLVDYKQEVIDCSKQLAAGAYYDEIYFRRGMAYYMLQRYNLARDDFACIQGEALKKQIPQQYPW